MGHRTGYIDGEGDGVGILTDLPRELWAKKLTRNGMRGSLATDRNFWVAHLMVPARDRLRAEHIVEEVSRQITNAGLHVLYEQPGKVDRQVLGPNAEKNEPAFWQIAGMNGQVHHSELDRTLFQVQSNLEWDLNVHFSSFSRHSVVYKVQGTVEILRRYYPELRDPDYASAVTLGHARYSTNTNPIFERAQPFGLLGHNGEFNTISRFRMEAEMLGIDLNPSNSDSQDVDRFIHALCAVHGFDLIEAMEFVFPPHGHDLIERDTELAAMYDEIRRAFGPFAQGPAGVASRLGDLCVFSVDALGLRPLWFGETEKEYFATSERGVYSLDAMTTDPKPLAPGEKIALKIHPGQSIEMLDYSGIQRHVQQRYRERVPYSAAFSGNGGGNGHDAPSGHDKPNGGSGLYTGYAASDARREFSAAPAATALEPQSAPVAVARAVSFPWHNRQFAVNTTLMSALGWERYHVDVVSTIGETRKEQIGALGWDGPIGALAKTRVNLADYFKEVVAVVTNPAIDREREVAQFSTRVIVGARPGLGQRLNPHLISIQLETPLLTGGHEALGDIDVNRAVAEQHGTMALEDLIDVFGERAVVFSATAADDESIEAALERIQQAVVEAARQGALCVVLDDTDALDGQRLWLDPTLLVAAVDRALRQAEHEGVNLRRRVGIVLRSGALRDLHDIVICLSFGANAIAPYAMYAAGLGIAPKAPKDAPDADTLTRGLANMVDTLTKGIQKVTSTIGCHELRGYGHAFAAIGLSKSVAGVFSTPNYFGSEGRGVTWDSLLTNAEERAAELRGEVRAKLDNPDRIYPKMWKKVEDIALGEKTREEYTAEMLELEARQPVAIRHILGFKETGSSIDPASVDTTTGRHSMPVLIGAMSYGSQGELSYKSYAEAAYRLNILCINGEGGELDDIMGKYPHHRGQQIASARFGVNIRFLNSCDYLEIKIGQGAKPGEGGHLPGFKVTEQVAAARHTVPGVDLISPSNNHDLYSIEDLAQLIDELKTANPHAKVSVKLPVVPGVGIIAVGVAKAGADVINITGYEGGTGAARAHALRHVGMPAEIGVWLAHRALTESGLRHTVEVWADGGMKSGRDVVKMMCLGADRVGFGTMAMVAVGCTICRKCHDGTCHVGITTHIKTREEAAAKGLKSFRPFTEQGSPDGIVNVFNMLQEDIRVWTARLGIQRTSDLVGRADLLEQIDMHAQIDLTPLLRRLPPTGRKSLRPGGPRLTRPRNTLSKQITSVVAECIAEGDYEMTYDDDQVMAMDRALGTHLAGAIVRGEFRDADRIDTVHLNFNNSAIPGNGLAAFIDAPIEVLVEGGAQDGVAKCARGGTVAILKGLNHNGQRLDGSVGKSFAYGAQGGLFIVQGNADTRACIRLSGADVIFGGEVTSPLRDELGNLASRANLKGYACEYMTSGRVMIMGDPGPWLGAGMTGGVIYQRIRPEVNLTTDAIKRRIAKGSVIQIYALDEAAIEDVSDLLYKYMQILENNNQAEAAEHMYALLRRPQDHFVKVAPPPRG
jgi:glutamate synthase (NADPH/NADH) large chain